MPIGGSGPQLLLRLKADADQAIREFDRVGEKQRSLGEKVQAGAKVATVALGAMAVEGVRQFTALDTGMREVFTLMPGMSEQAMGQMTDDVKAFAQEYGLTTDQVIPALYQAISAGVPPDNVLTFMETAAEAARGGVTDLATSVDGLTSVVNAYGTDVISASQAADIMFTTVRLGKTNFEEMSSSMFQVVPVAAQLGIGFDQVGAAVVALTAQGTPTSVAMTQIRGALVELSKDGTAAFGAFEQATGQTFPAFIAQGGTVGEAMGLLGDYAAEAGVPLTNLFGSVEGGMAAAAMASETGRDRIADAMAGMSGSAGATGEAFDMMAGGVGFSMDQLKSRVEGLMLTFGEAMIPILDEMMPAVENLVGAFGGLVGMLGQVDGLLPGVIASVGALALGLGPVGAAIAGIVTLGVSLGGGPVENIEKFSGAVGGLHDAVLAGEEDLGSYRQGLIDVGFSAEEADEAVANMRASVEQSAEVAGLFIEAGTGMVDSILAVAEAQGVVVNSGVGASTMLERLTRLYGDQKSSIEGVIAAEEELADERRAAVDPLFAVMRATEDLIDAQDRLDEALATDDMVAAREATEDLYDAQMDLNEATGQLDTTDAVEGLAAVLSQAGLTEEAIDRVVGSIVTFNNQPVYDKYFNIFGVHETVAGGAGAGWGGSGYQEGGRVWPGQFAVVGEGGEPELIRVTGQGVDVIPFSKIPGLQGGGKMAAWSEPTKMAAWSEPRKEAAWIEPTKTAAWIEPGKEAAWIGGAAPWWSNPSYIMDRFASLPILETLLLAARQSQAALGALDVGRTQITNAPVNVNVYVSGYVATEMDLVKTIRRELLRVQARNATTGIS